MDKGQLQRFSKGDIELFKKMFGERDLFTLRKFLYQIELSKGESLDFKKDEFLLLKKLLIPSNTDDVPLFQQDNLYHPLLKIREYHPEVAQYHIAANDILINYFRQEFNNLVTGDTKREIVLEDLPKEGRGEDRFTNILAYHNICACIEGRMQQIQNMLNVKEELTPKQQKEKLEKDSTQ